MMKRQREQGVALLLALGVLSLLLVSGLAFVTNALLAQKSAAAYRFRSQSQLLGKSAVNRVMMLMRYYLEAGDAEGIGQLYSTPNGAVQGQSGDIPANAEQDQLTPAADSLLTAVVDNTVRNAPSTPRWEYMWDDYDNNGRRTNDAKLVGRFAYWVLPGGSVNFSEVLRGNTNLSGPNSMSTWTRRRGFGIRELHIAGTSYLAAARLDELDEAFTGESFGTDPRQQDSIRTNDYSSFVSMFNRAPALSLTDRNVIRRFLPPSGTEEEVYFSISGYDRDSFNPFRESNLTKYHRFDLTRLDWAALGGTSVANSDTLVERLLGTPTERTDGETVDDTAERTSHAIPALRRIHAAADHYSSLTNRRKQVAANLIDYCDTDSIATSDSTNWETTAPNYTGNDRTPYINEIMISPSVGITRDEAATSSADGGTTYTYTYNAAIDLRMIAVELINMYEASFPNCDIAIKGECTMEITADNQTPQTVTVSFDIPLTGTAGACTTVNGNYAYKILYTEGSASGISATGWSEITTVASATRLTDPVKAKVKVTRLEVSKVHLKTADGNADYVRDLEADIDMTATELEGTNSGNSSTATAYPHVGFEVDDPRENLYQGSLTDENMMNWRKIASAASATDNDGNAMDADTMPEKIADFTFNAKNAFCNPANTTGIADRDLETAADPENISTAYIANESMKTLTELGAIHRAAKWQTINLRASRCTPATEVNSDLDAAGDTYQDGDAWILDQVKLTPKVLVPHRLYINNPPGSGSVESQLLYAALFRGLVWDWDKHYNYSYSGTSISNADALAPANVLAGRNANDKFFSRAELINYTSGGNMLWNAYGLVAPATDASAETIPALVSGLISFFPRSPDPVTMILVAQSIRDVGTASGFSMSKLRNDGSGNSDSRTVHSGQFDYDGTTYFDEITGTSRYYVEIGTNPTSRKVDILRFEPLD